MTKYILFDTKTTGNEESDRIIQVGAIIVGQDGNTNTYDELCLSSENIKFEAMEVHGITPDLLTNKSKFINTDFYKELMSLNNQDNFLISHDMKFNLSMLDKEGFKSNMKHIDTLRCAKHLFDDSPYYRLRYFRYSLEIYKEEEKESAKLGIKVSPKNNTNDVLVMKLFLSKLVKKCKEKYPKENPMNKLEELTKTPVFIKTFQFGKYQGRNIEDICDEDIGYINWMMEKIDLDEDMKWTFDKIMNGE